MVRLRRRTSTVPLFGSRAAMDLAREQRAAAGRQVRVLFAAVWLPVLLLLAWRVLASDAGSLSLRAGALGVFAAGAAVTAVLVLRRASTPLVLARIDRVGAPASGAGTAPSVALHCTCEDGAKLLARLEVSGEVVLSPGDWTLLVAGRSGLLAPWQVPAGARSRLGLPA